LNNLSAVQVRRYDKVNGETIQHFFTELRAHNGSDKRIHVILDSACYHRVQVVKDKAIELNLELLYFPVYNANLNSIERLWKVKNEHVRNNKYFAMAKEFRGKIYALFSQTLPNIGGTLEGRMNNISRAKICTLKCDVDIS
jgi:transposase